ncbi:MAG TPA: AMP-binding protein [Bryobacteraceae bacterium]|nr:AMP-binding protein [Bryobacteraceae bacterium]
MESYARGPARRILRRSMGEVLLETAARLPQGLALVSCHQNIRMTWSEYAWEAQRTAAGLHALGLRPGDRVGMWATNCAEWALLQFGCALAGIVLVNLNPAYRPHELSYVLRKSGLRVLFMQEADARTNYQRVLEESIALCAGHTIALEHTIYLDTPQWTGFLKPPSPSVIPIHPDEPANMQYTSGTTGQPKGVVLTHVNIVNNGRFIAEYLQLSDKDRVCVPVPLFHCFGCVAGTMAAVAVGATVVLPAPSFSALDTLESIATEKCTAIYGVPAMFIAELNAPEFLDFDLSTLRTGIMAGAPCPIEVMKQVVSRMHCPEMVVAYGQTESSPVITMSRDTDSVEVRCNTVGSPLPETEVRIASPEGETVPLGEQGELLTRGYLVMKCYDGEPEATARSVDPQGWLHTGDLAVMREDGNFRITGRAKDMIIRGGENISPREIEEFLLTHAKIAEVYVVGLPDEKLGEIVGAWVRLKPGAALGAEEVRAYCRGQLAHFKIPHHIRFVDSFPMTLSGKAQKFKIREFEIEALGLEKAAAQEMA